MVNGKKSLRESLHEVIFEADTPWGRFFDIVLLILILTSVIVVMLETVDSIAEKYKGLFLILEWIFTIVFTIEYLLRLYSVYRPWKYAKSFFGIVDLLSILPSYLSLLPFISGSQSLMIIRAIRLLRVFRIFKLGHYMNEGRVIINALRASRAKIFVFLYAVILLVIIIGSVMYLVEGGPNKNFSQHSKKYLLGDCNPNHRWLRRHHPYYPHWTISIRSSNDLGLRHHCRFQRALSQRRWSMKPVKKNNTQACRYCAREGHDDDAIHCKYCGELLNEH